LEFELNFSQNLGTDLISIIYMNLKLLWLGLSNIMHILMISIQWFPIKSLSLNHCINSQIIPNSQNRFKNAKGSFIFIYFAYE